MFGYEVLCFVFVDVVVGIGCSCVVGCLVCC